MHRDGSFLALVDLLFLLLRRNFDESFPLYLLFFYYYLFSTPKET